MNKKRKHRVEPKPLMAAKPGLKYVGAKKGKVLLDKKAVIRSLQQLPHKFSPEEAIYKIMVLKQVELGLRASLEGNVIPDEDLDKRLPEWLG